jgi:galactosamine-6-phosphate isomerase
MHIKIFDTHQFLSEAAADEMLQLIQRKPTAVVCLASGGSPKLTCELFCKKVKETGTDVSFSSWALMNGWDCHPPYREAATMIL